LKKFNKIDKVGKDFYVKTLEIPVQLSASFDEDEEIQEVYDRDSSSDKMEIQMKSYMKKNVSYIFNVNL
jgi:hypothetical protein